VITAIIVAFVIELAPGYSGAPCVWLGAIAGLTYLVVIASSGSEAEPECASPSVGVSSCASSIR